MLALIKGSGRLPELVAQRLTEQGKPPLICAIDPAEAAPHHVSLGTLGTLLGHLREAGVTEICMAGAIDRTKLVMGAPDAATQPLVPALTRALRAGDGQALAHLHDLFEQQGFVIRAAQEICPDLLPSAGVLSVAAPGKANQDDAARAAQVLSILGQADIGQACVVEQGQVLAVETLPGTDDMLAQAARFRAAQGWGQGGVFFKAPKPGQDMRSDLPTIGIQTARAVVQARLTGIVIEAGGVMVLDRETLTDILDAAGAFLWVRDR